MRSRGLLDRRDRRGVASDLLNARLSRTLRRRRSARAVNATVGAVFVALGSRLALASH